MTTHAEPFEQQEPIAAIATPIGTGALGVIRISGKGVLTIAGQLFRKTSDPTFDFSRSKGFHAHLGSIHDENGMIDEVIALVFRTPNSFTKEDMIEFSCHGGMVVVRQILKTILDHGCRMAEPGEFTRRAFLNGRIDLLQAEAVGEMIHAQSEAAARSAVRHLQGDLSSRLETVRQELLQSAALLELELDFSEEDVEFISRSSLQEQLLRIHQMLQALAASYHQGRMLKEGVCAVIAGRPNAGKSTLLNQLLGHQRAIVSDQPGTTRDYIEESFIHQTVMYRLIDTAGIRQAGNAIEEAGISRSYAKFSESDLILYLLDITLAPCTEDIALLGELASTNPRARILVLANKCDQVDDIPERIKQLRQATESEVIAISAARNIGIEALKEQMEQHAGLHHIANDSGITVTSLRHYDAIRNSLTALEAALLLVADERETALIAYEIRTSLRYIGEITGSVINDEILDHVFSRFCIGK